MSYIDKKFAKIDATLADMHAVAYGKTQTSALRTAMGTIGAIAIGNCLFPGEGLVILGTILGSVVALGSIYAMNSDDRSEALGAFIDTRGLDYIFDDIPQYGNDEQFDGLREIAENQYNAENYHGVLHTIDNMTALQRRRAESQL